MMKPSRVPVTIQSADSLVLSGINDLCLLLYARVQRCPSGCFCPCHRTMGWVIGVDEQGGWLPESAHRGIHSSYERSFHVSCGLATYKLSQLLLAVLP